jgi:5-methylcytosine-specific restriction protein A
MAASRNPPWERDELILALDLYFRHRPSTISQTHPEVVELSKILNGLPIHAERPDRARFRNPNGVYMKLCNFLALDPSYHGKGLERGGRGEQQVWNDFHHDRAALRRLAEAIKAGYGTAAAQPAAAEEEDEDAFPEGKVLYRMHRARERNRKLVQAAKARALKREGRLDCAVCHFDFASAYGSLGDGFIECHHALPLSELKSEQKTRVADVALLCSNCHRMVHRRRPWLSISELEHLLNFTAEESG